MSKIFISFFNTDVKSAINKHSFLIMFNNASLSLKIKIFISSLNHNSSSTCALVLT